VSKPSLFVAAEDHSSRLRSVVTSVEEIMERELKKKKKRPKAPTTAKRPKVPKSSNSGNVTGVTASPSSQSTVKIAETPSVSTASPSSQATSKPSVSTASPSFQPTSKPSVSTASPSSQPTVNPWQKLGSDIDGEAGGDKFGTSVSLSSDGHVLAIGAPRNDGDNGADSGHVRVYAWNGSSWDQMGDDIDGEAGCDRSGYTVSLSNDGKVLAIGAYGNDGNGDWSGHVRVYIWNDTSSTWEKRGDDIDSEAAGDTSGRYVSLSSDGTVLAIGAPYNSGNGYYRSGHVRVYKWNGSSWEQKGIDIDGEAANDNSGWSVSLSSNGNVVAIGALYNDGNGSNSGHVRVYEWNDMSSIWELKGMDIDGEAADDNSGRYVSLSSDGNVVAIGAYGNDDNGSNSGHVRVYEWNDTSSTWELKGTDIDGEAAGDNSGYSVSLSSDGNVVAIGAYGNDGNGSNSGHVRVYEWNAGTSSWELNGTDIDGEAAGDESGRSVSLSSDGTVLAIGAISNDGDNGADSGHVRVYKYMN